MNGVRFYTMEFYTYVIKQTLLKYNCCEVTENVEVFADGQIL
jgi:hypothetical protein